MNVGLRLSRFTPARGGIGLISYCVYKHCTYYMYKYTITCTHDTCWQVVHNFDKIHVCFTIQHFNRQLLTNAKKANHCHLWMQTHCLLTLLSLAGVEVDHWSSSQAYWRPWSRRDRPLCTSPTRTDLMNGEWEASDAHLYCWVHPLWTTPSLSQKSSWHLLVLWRSALTQSCGLVYDIC